MDYRKKEQILDTTDSENYWLDTRRKQKITLDWYICLAA
jgi:hypothetical protein